MKYWITAVDRRNYEIIRKNLLWGMGGRYEQRIHLLTLGDYLVFYINGEMVIAGIFEVDSEVFKGKGIFHGGSFPSRVKLHSISTIEDSILFDKELRGRMDFITNKRNWSGHLRHGITEISKNDFEILRKFLTSNMS